MVLAERFGQLKMRVIRRGCDAADDTALFEHVQVPVGRALWEVGRELDDFGQGQWLGRFEHRFDEASTAGRVALVGTRQPPTDLFVDVVRHRFEPASGNGGAPGASVGVDFTDGPGSVCAWL